MAGNIFGIVFRLITYGESHGAAIGGVVDGCPSGIMMDSDFIQSELNRRRPGQTHLTSPRDEKDPVEILSGVFNGMTTGAPIAFIVPNKDAHPEDYTDLNGVFRPSHADYAYYKKYGIYDHRGGGRASARETIARVVGGAIAKMILKDYGITIRAYVSSIGQIALATPYDELDLTSAESSPVRCPDSRCSEEMTRLLETIIAEGDSIGGSVTCVIKQVPAGLGEPVFDKLQADLAKAMLSINAVKGFEYGSGFKGSSMKGSEHNDQIIATPTEHDPVFHTLTNYSGGIQGGISNGEDIYFKVAFKPAAGIRREQRTADIHGNVASIIPGKRYDACVAIRAVPIVEAMAAIVITDHLLRQKAYSK
ncbi:MAG: chorismate synthase [Bacteroidetes bacterium]|nr:chorismate synthase [Bacteroidota bacterium]